MELTYILFQKQDQNVVEIIGPIFEEEIECEMIENFGSNASKTEVLEESLFALLYPEEYSVNKTVFWSNYLATILDNLNVYFDYNIDDQDDQIESDQFCAYLHEEDGKTSLFLCFAVDIDPILSASITLEVYKTFHNIYPIQIGDPFLIAEDDEVYTNDQAYLVNSTIPFSLN